MTETQQMRRLLSYAIVAFSVVVLNFYESDQQSAHAQVGVIEVKSEGNGPTKNDAILDAIVSAISQVNGADIAAQTAVTVREQSKQTSEGDDYVNSEDFKRKVATTTNGIVQSWSLLSASQDASLNNIWLATVDIKISKYKSSDQLKRLRMALVPFRIGEELKNKASAESFGRTFTEQLQNYLTDSRRFAMLDREFLGEQNAELKLIRNGGAKTEELARLGNRAGTDYLIVGVIEKAYSQSTTRTLQTTGQKVVTVESGGGINYRIIDVATTQVKFSDGATFSENGGDADDAAKQLANIVGERIVNSIYPIRIISISGDSVTLGQGGSTVRKGQKYKIVKLGNKLIDPYTKEIIGREEKEIGELVIQEVQSKISNAKIISTTVDLNKEFSETDFIVRPNKDAETNSSSADAARAVEQVKKNGKDAVETLEKGSKNEW
jgi:curli biogenesis system outer membrane secretion channel CsgG